MSARARHIYKDEGEKFSINQLARIITGDIKIDERAIELVSRSLPLPPLLRCLS